MNTCQQGLPQSRPRLYIAALLKDAKVRPFKWPKPCSAPTLLSVLDRKRKHDTLDITNESSTVQENMQWAQLHAKEKKINLSSKKSVVVVDAGASAKYRHMMVDMMPCVTRTAAMSCRYIIVNQSGCRRVTVNELAKVQGVGLNRFDTSGLTRSQIGGMIGNAMSRNILDRVLPRLLFSVGVLKKLPRDKWADGEVPI